MKVCATCKIDKFESEFYSNKVGDYRFLRNECKPCLKFRQTAARFGMTVDALKQMYVEQDFRCKICKEACSVYENLSVDHDHRCCPTRGRSCGECIRGLLCTHCNKSLGGFKDDVKLLQSAIEYLGD